MSKELEVNVKNELKLIDHMEKCLPRLKELADKKDVKSELDALTQSLTELKARLPSVLEQHATLKVQLDEKNREFVRLRSKLEPWYAQAYHDAIELWRVSPQLLVMKALILGTVMVMIITTAIYWSDPKVPIISMLVGVGITAVVSFINKPKYWQFGYSCVFAIVLLIISLFSNDESLRWTLISVSIAMVALGISIQSFGSGEIVERKLVEIDQNIKNLLKDNEQNGTEK